MVVVVVADTQHLHLMPTITKWLVVMVLAEILSLEVKEEALAHEEILLNIMVVMVAALSLVKVVVGLAVQMRQAVLALGMVVAAVAAA
jgi:hypothetical protein